MHQALCCRAVNERVAYGSTLRRRAWDYCMSMSLVWVLCVQRLMGEMQKLDESRQHEVSMWKV